MPRGGKRLGAGRPVGTINRVSLAAKEAANATGVSPLEYMLSIMRDENAPVERRDDMAKAAASFVHPRLAASTVTLNDKRDATDWTREELVAFLGDAPNGGKGVAKTNGSGREPDSVH
jgi:hypothetical protein